MDDKKRGYWNDTHNFVIPVRDAGIWEFYQVGEHKSYVKMHHFMENWIPVSSTGMTKKGGTGTTGEGATWMTKKRGTGMTGGGATWMTSWRLLEDTIIR